MLLHKTGATPDHRYGCSDDAVAADADRIAVANAAMRATAAMQQASRNLSIANRISAFLKSLVLMAIVQPRGRFSLKMALSAGVCVAAALAMDEFRAIITGAYVTLLLLASPDAGSVLQMVLVTGITSGAGLLAAYVVCVISLDPVWLCAASSLCFVPCLWFYTNPQYNFQGVLPYLTYFSTLVSAYRNVVKLNQIMLTSFYAFGFALVVVVCFFMLLFPTLARDLVRERFGSALREMRSIYVDSLRRRASPSIYDGALVERRVRLVQRSLMGLEVIPRCVFDAV